MAKKKVEQVEVEVAVETKPFDLNMIESNISSYAEVAYLEYAMSVVKGRAIPSVEDGLKPVHRRILYAMFKEGMTYNSVHKKSARVVGNVLGLYHPHGDQSVYQALVRQAQSFSIRYPLIDGQGNFGSRDGDGAASMRYTESKLTPITQLYMDEIRDQCVDFMPNYDGSESEPVVLPARIPFILLNGNPGIAVGMATDIPCHNTKEVIQAVIAYLENEQIDLDGLMQYIKGPDYPTGGQIISSPNEIKKMYEEGRGSVRVRSKYHVEGEGTKAWKLVFDEIPQIVSVQKVMEEIDALFNPEDRTKKDSKGNAKKISPEQSRLKALFTSLIGKYTDASDKNNPCRLVVEPKSPKQDPNELIQTLLAYTSLETNIAANFVVVGRDGRPVQKTLMEIIQEWTEFRLETIERRVKYHLQKIAERLHILDGRQTILSYIDEVIKIIKTSENPKEDLIDTFSLSEIQAQDVLELKLRQIGRLELDGINKEIDKLTKEQTDLQKIIANETNLKKQMIKELKSDMDKFGDDRVTEIKEAEKVDLSAVQEKIVMVAQEDVTLAISEKSWVKTVKGHKTKEEISFKEGDSVDYIFHCKNTDTLCIFDVEGKVYNYNLIEINKDGVPLNTLAQINSKIALVCPINKDNKYVINQDAGYGFVVTGENLMTRQKAGKEMVTVWDNSKIFQPLAVLNNEDTSVIKMGVITTENKFLMYKLNNISVIGKGKGVVTCGLPEGQRIKDVKLIRPGEEIKFTVIGKNGKENEFILKDEESVQFEKGRATKGNFLPLKDKDKLSEISFAK
jgi:topoisomerase-4 subunit A